MIRNTEEACVKSCMPLLHAHCFQRVADDTKCMIASRSVGKFATGLILESYASKGFHVKTKSCNWGPMAGFVCSDPRFSKEGIKGMEAQRKRTQKALRYKRPSGFLKETPIVISNARVRELVRLGCMNRGWLRCNALWSYSEGRRRQRLGQAHELCPRTLEELVGS